jgi:hypothetical protein
MIDTRQRIALLDRVKTERDISAYQLPNSEFATATELREAEMRIFANLKSDISRAKREKKHLLLIPIMFGD